jgi:hypothetical protein
LRLADCGETADPGTRQYALEQSTNPCLNKHIDTVRSARSQVGLRCSLGLICIVLIMTGSTKRLARKQMKRHGVNAEFLKYCRTVRVLFPRVPACTSKNIRVYPE